MREHRHLTRRRPHSVLDVDGVEEVGQLLGRARDQPARRFAGCSELGPALEALDLAVTVERVGMTAPSPLDQLAADQPDRGQQHGRLHVVASVDRERAVRDGEEEVERDRRDDARGDARSPAADDRDPEHDEHQDQGEVRRRDMAAQRHERADSGDRDQRRASDTDHHSTMYERATIGSRLLTRS